MSGPLPSRSRRRRNAPTIPTTELPASGRKGRIPKPPAWVELGDAGAAYWVEAWRSPQSAAWGVGQGFEPLVARRAMLEDDLAALERCEEIDGLLEAIADDHARQAVRALIGHLLSLATGRLAIVGKMLDIEDRLGLTPKAREQLRWTVVDDAPKTEDPEVTASGVASMADRRARLTSAS